MKDKAKNVLIIAMAILIIALIASLGYVITSKKEKMQDIMGKVIIAGKEYVIITYDNEDFLINGIEATYEIGDEIKISYREKNYDDTTSPKSILAEREALIKRESKEDTPYSKEPETPSTSTVNPPKGNSSIESAEVKNVDIEVLEYVTNLEDEFKKGSIKDTLKSGFITVVDFIFYNGSIKGHTFKDLSNSAKLKILSVALYFDDKIEIYFPGYKEAISNTTGKTYTKVKEQITESYLNIAATVCENNEDLCKSAKEGFGEIKKNFGLSWSLIKDIAGDGVSKLKTWYEIYSGK